MGLNPEPTKYQKCALAKLFEFCGSRSSFRDGCEKKSISQKLFRELTEISSV